MKDMNHKGAKVQRSFPTAIPPSPTQLSGLIYSTCYENHVLNIYFMLDMVAYATIPSTPEAEARGSLWGQPDLLEFYDGQGYIEKLCLQSVYVFVGRECTPI